MEKLIAKLGLMEVEHIHRYYLNAKVGEFLRQLQIHAFIAAVIWAGNQDEELLVGAGLAEDFPAFFYEGLLKTGLGGKCSLKCPALPGQECLASWRVQ